MTIFTFVICFNFHSFLLDVFFELYALADTFERFFPDFFQPTFDFLVTFLVPFLHLRH